MKRIQSLKKRSFLTVTLIGLLLVCAVYGGISTFGAGDDVGQTIYFSGKRLSERGYTINNTIYIPTSVAQSYGDISGLTIDTSSKKIRIDLSEQNIIMADDATTQFIKTYGGEIYIPMKNIDGCLYIPLNSAEQFLKLSSSIQDDSIRLFRYSGREKTAKVRKNSAIGICHLASPVPGVSFPLKKGETVFIKGESENYYKIETQTKTAGYVMKSDIEISDIDLSKVDFYAPKKTKYVRGKEKINLVWQYVGNAAVLPPAKKYGGVDILAPTWFHLTVDGKGEVENNGDLGYKRAAADLGYKIFATITNSMSTKGSTDFTSSVFSNNNLLNKSVAQFIFYSCLYDVDGINIDYEQVKDSDAAGLTAFTALMRSYAERQGLNLSIDTLIPKPWTIEYDRKSLAKYVDFLAVMTYDEHYSGSPVAGSVSSYPWTEEALRNTLKEVPAEKLLMGIPLYTRVWVVDSAGKVIRNPSATMPYIDNLIEEKKLVPTWLEKERQYFISYPNGAYVDKIWVEDSRSIANRLQLLNNLDLAGSACWQFSQASEGIWDVFDGMLKKGKKISDYE